ncbi:MAG: hypothetical protein ACFCU6_00445 [Balneolaceae bacterium]
MKNLLTLFTMILVGTLIMMSCDTTNSGTNENASVQLQMLVNTGNIMPKQIENSGQLEGIVIEEVKLFIEEMELESIQNDSLDFEIENFIVNLPLDGSPLFLTEQDIPAGIYDEFELEIEKPDDIDVQVNDPDFRDETGSYSVVVKGLFNDEEFRFRSTEDFEIDIDINPPFEIGEGENSVMVISVDVSSWFKGSNGEDLDPKDPMNTEQINNNIETSFEVFKNQFEDDDD